MVRIPKKLVLCLIVPFGLAATGCGGSDSAAGIPDTVSPTPCAILTPDPLAGWQGTYTETDTQCNSITTRITVKNNTSYEVFQLTATPGTFSSMAVKSPAPQDDYDWSTRAENAYFKQPLVSNGVATVPPGATLDVVPLLGIRLYIKVDKYNTPRMIVAGGLANLLGSFLPKNPEQRAEGTLASIATCADLPSRFQLSASSNISSYQFWVNVSGLWACKKFLSSFTPSISKDVDAAASATKDFFMETLPKLGDLLTVVLLEHR
jgi:hypothetical protein